MAPAAQFGDLSPHAGRGTAWQVQLREWTNAELEKTPCSASSPRIAQEERRALEADTTHTDISDISEIPFYGKEVLI
jgi:hypothetical protein